VLAVLLLALALQQELLTQAAAAAEQRMALHQAQLVAVLVLLSLVR
jgi:hypothetical protein